MAYLYMAMMALVTYLIRVIPLTFFRKKIENPIFSLFFFMFPLLA